MRIPVLGVEFDNVTMAEAVDKALALMDKRGCYAVTPNPEMILQSRKDPAFAKALNGADLVLPDGIGDIYAARILGTPLKERVPGADIYPHLLAHLAQQSGSVFLYGARPGVAEQAAANLKAAYPGLGIAGTEHGYIEDDAQLLTRIREVRPDLLLVCLGAPRQELWMHAHAGMEEVGLMIGLGGCLDLMAGHVKRAPVLWQKWGLEWLYRLCQEPSRITRMIRLPKILFLAWIARAKERR